MKTEMSRTEKIIWIAAGPAILAIIETALYIADHAGRIAATY